MLVTARLIRLHEEAEGPPPLSQLLDELEPGLGEGAYAIVEAARDLDAFIDLHEGEKCNARENRRRLRTSPTEFITRVPDLRPTLERLLHMIRMEAPSPADLHSIARDAHQVAIWAEQHGAPRTALIYAQLAQEADEDSGVFDPQFEFDLGRLAVALPAYREAGLEWLEQAAGRARELGRTDLAERAAALLAEAVERAT